MWLVGLEPDVSTLDMQQFLRNYLRFHNCWNKRKVHSAQSLRTNPFSSRFMNEAHWTDHNGADDARQVHGQTPGGAEAPPSFPPPEQL